MWGFLLGVYIVYIIHPFFEEWRQHRADRKRLADMRQHFKMGHRWDAAKGQWQDNSERDGSR